MATELDFEHARATLGAFIAKAFLTETEALPPEKITFLARGIDEHLGIVRRAAASSSPSIDLQLAEQIGSACHALLGRYEQLDEPSRAAIVGAVRYFVSSEDSDDDLRSVFGFEDDARVVNYAIDFTKANVPRLPE